jgi:hypothetical protein
MCAIASRSARSRKQPLLLGTQRLRATRRIALEEVGVYTVKDDLITREQFFYDGAH